MIAFLYIYGMHLFSNKILIQIILYGNISELVSEICLYKEI